MIFQDKSSKEIWGILNKRGVVDNTDNFGEVDPNYLNNAFSSNQTFDDVSVEDISQFNNDGFSFRSVESFEMTLAFNKIKSKAVGYDGFALKFIKLLFPLVGNYILHLVNTILTTSTFPKLWKIAKIVPISKNNGMSDIDNLRPISILPILSKMVEYLMKDQLMLHINDNCLLHDSQSGFRCNRSTTSVLVGLTDNIRRKVANKGFCVLLSLDLAKAFDRVSHSLLIQKLHRFFGFSGSACKLISSYLMDRKQYVFSNGSCSDILPVHSGVPQGSVLGPLLFIMFVNDLFDILTNNMCLPLAFADDIQILFKGDKQFPDVMQSMIDYTVELLGSWMASNYLCVNSRKSKAMLFGSCGVNNISIDLNGDAVEFVDKLKCLGVILDTKLRFEDHVNTVVSKVNFTLRKLYCLDVMLPFNVKLNVVHALIMPIFLYCLEVYSGALGYVMKKIRLAFNRVMRYLFSLRLRHHISSYVSKFLGCSFDNFVKYRCIMHFYKVYKLQIPIYLVDLFVFGRSTRNRQLVIPKLTPLLERSFLVRVARKYNLLPNALKTFDLTVDTYRKKLLKEISQNT